MNSTCYFTYNVEVSFEFTFFPASKASWEVEHLTERKNPHIPVKIAILHIFMRSLVHKKLHPFQKFQHHLLLGLYFLPFLPCVPPQKIVKWVNLDSVSRLKSNF